MLGLGVSSASQLGGTAFALENSILAAFKTRVLADSGVVEDYACLNLDVKDLITEPAPFTTGLLEFYPGAAAAYSLRQLRRSVFPYAIRVRRANDDEQDIGFNSNGELDTNALLDFADSGDAWVSVWYDQSSNGNHATQGTNADQPQIVDRITGLVTENGKPAVQFTDSKFEVGSTDLYGQTDFDAYIAYATSDTSYILFGDSYSSGYFSYVINSGEVANTSLQSGYNETSLYVNGAEVSIDGATTTREDLYNACVLGTMTLEVHQGHTTSSWVDFKINAYNGRHLTGNVSEIILYNSDQSANRTGIESNINDFYSIYS